MYLRNSSSPLSITGASSGVTALSSGDYHSCALYSSGGVKCWGGNGYLALGINSPEDSHVALDVVGLSSGVVAVAAGGYHTCALLSSGGVKCWGFNEGGAVGYGSNNQVQAVPIDVLGLSQGVVAVTAGKEQSCARLEAGGMRCWGGNGFAQLGDGSSTNRSAPVDVSGLSLGITVLTTTTTTTTIAPTTTVSPLVVAPSTAPPVEAVIIGLPARRLLADASLSTGSSVTLEYGGFAPGEFVQLIVASNPVVIASGYANSQGVVRLTGYVPTNLSAGSHSIALYAPTSGGGVRQTINVVPSVLPATGLSTLLWEAILILITVLILSLSTRRLSSK
jgi:hypothetical protein